jgi:hemerythrin
MRLRANDIPEVAVAAMHAMHLEEMEMINAIYELLEAIEAGGSKAGLAGNLDELLDHTREHFAGEEALMEQYHFPPYPVHKDAHDLFLHKMEQIVSDWKADQRLGPVIQFMRSDLPIWIKDHIGTMDFVTAKFIAMQMEKP